VWQFLEGFALGDPQLFQGLSVGTEGATLYPQMVNDTRGSNDGSGSSSI
jgi:hypothetical protein